MMKRFAVLLYGVVVYSIFFATFLYWFWYAYAPSHRERMEAAGRMPFENEDTPLSDGGEL